MSVAKWSSAVWIVGVALAASACGKSSDPDGDGDPAVGTPDAGDDTSSAELDAGAPGEGAADAADTTDTAGFLCEPGQPRICQGETGCRGIQPCADDGSGYGGCDCDEVPLREGEGVIGASCESSDDCRDGTTCLTADSNDYFGNGGPAGGYCTTTCEGDADCQAVDELSGCARLGDVSLCIRTCLSKSPEPGERKCLDRPDLVCRSVVADRVEPLLVERQDGRCVPRCGSDADCPAGRVCHAQGGICTDAPPPGGPVGAACMSGDDCSGRLCDGLSAGDVGVCTAPCVLGQLSGCGFTADDPARGAACLTSFVQTAGFTEGLGDLGICREVCDVDADCLRVDEGWGCRPLNQAQVEFFGRSGACVPLAP